MNIAKAILREYRKHNPVITIDQAHLDIELLKKALSSNFYNYFDEINNDIRIKDNFVFIAKNNNESVATSVHVRGYKPFCNKQILHLELSELRRDVTYLEHPILTRMGYREVDISIALDDTIILRLIGTLLVRINLQEDDKKLFLIKAESIDVRYIN